MSSDNSRDMLAILAGPGPDVFTTRPVIMGTHGMVTSGHYLASRIGLHILEEGGNAVDAGVAMGFALAVLEPYIYGIGGEVPILVYLSDEKRVVSLSGQGRPAAATIEGSEARDRRHPAKAAGRRRPDAVSTWISALSRFGSIASPRSFPLRGARGAGLPHFDGPVRAPGGRLPQSRGMPSSPARIFPAAIPPWARSIRSRTSRFFTRLGRGIPGAEMGAQGRAGGGPERS